MLTCNINHCACFNIDRFRVSFILNLRTGMKLCPCKDMELLKEFYALFLHKCRNRIYHGWKIRESSSLCLLNPLIGVAISIEHDLLMLSRIGLDQIMQGLLKIFRLLQRIASLAERLSHNGVQNDIWRRSRIS